LFNKMANKSNFYYKALEGCDLISFALPGL
jgi:hypothetical protein